MGIRSRVKNRLKKLVGGGGTPQPAASSPAPRSRTEPERPAPTPAPVPASAPAAKPLAPPAKTPEEEQAAAKAAAHMEKTRRAVLRFVEEAGGESGLAEMHDYSERRWFVGHKKFSDLMEGLVAEALLDYNGAEGRAALTEAGRQYLEDNPPPKRR